MASEANFSLEGTIGFQVGAVGEMAISRNLSVQAGLGMLRVNFDYLIESSQTGDYRYEQKIIYIENPVMMKYYFHMKGALKTYVQGGVSGKFDLYQREKSEEFGNYWFTESSDSDAILAHAPIHAQARQQNVATLPGGHPNWAAREPLGNPYSPGLVHADALYAQG